MSTINKKFDKQGLQLRVHKVMWTGTRYSDFFQSKTYIMSINNFAALGLNLRVNAATLNLSLPLYLLKLNIENELNDVALPFDGDLTSMRNSNLFRKDNIRGAF